MVRQNFIQLSQWFFSYERIRGSYQINHFGIKSVHVRNRQQFASPDKGKDFVSCQDFFIDSNIRTTGGGQNHLFLFINKRDRFTLMLIATLSLYEMFDQHTGHNIGLILSGCGNKGVHINKTGSIQDILI